MSDEFDGWGPDMLRTAISFERVTIAELRLDLHKARMKNEAFVQEIEQLRAENKEIKRQLAEARRCHKMSEASHIEHPVLAVSADDIAD